MSRDSTDRATVRIEDVPAFTRTEAMDLAAAETARMAAFLAALRPDEWRHPTDCPAWDVRAMAGHVLGMTETFTGTRRMMTDMRHGGQRAGDGPFIDGLTALQVDERAHLDTAELVRRLEDAGPRQARWRGRVRLLRAMPMKEEVNGRQETWRMGYLVDVILTRDTWMHRVDAARATGRTMVLTPEHDGRLVAHVVAEWARRHDRPFRLHLTGPAGGSFARGTDGEELTLDAVQFCRILSGRGEGQGLLATEVPF
ncbi:maleylpyruvate isomerase family mycothiol-dependent enzyme [Actinomycetospora aeridis]|uniref:Maleylpyruvate isomerase family mycothiol-dependent enzyme n=1 Tax=Actinomycetospora aeridis TaxID=3129231 RepID=A0ABU8N4G9_9PSEU